MRNHRQAGRWVFAAPEAPRFVIEKGERWVSTGTHYREWLEMEWNPCGCHKEESFACRYVEDLVRRLDCYCLWKGRETRERLEA